MKTIITKNLIVLCLISLMLALGACSKYEDGPWISFRSVEKRLCGKKWEVVYFAKGDTELTESWRSQYNWLFFLVGHPDGNLGLSANVYVYNQNSIDVCSGVWRFWSNSDPQSGIYDATVLEFLLMSDNDTMGIVPLITDRELREFKILRLTIPELWLKYTDSSGLVYTLQFKSK